VIVPGRDRKEAVKLFETIFALLSPSPAESACKQDEGLRP